MATLDLVLSVEIAPEAKAMLEDIIATASALQAKLEVFEAMQAAGRLVVAKLEPRTSHATTCQG